MESNNNKGSVDWTLLTRYVSGACSEDEEIVIETWAAANPENRQLLEELRGVWKRVSRREISLPVDVDAAWDELTQRIREEEYEQGPPERATSRGDRPAQRPKRERSRSRMRQTIFTGAASVAVIIVAALAFLVFEELPESSESPEEKVFSTQRGQRAVVQLIDGTEVRLNVDSRLRLPEDGFAEDRREVKLEGEAYFDVARDTSRPFRVHAQDASARVLGTAFNMKDYPDDQQARVAVTEGEVALQSGRSEIRDTVLLRARHLGVVSDHHREVHYVEDLSQELGWTEGQLVFRDAPFSEVVRKLGRWYDLQIEAKVASEEVDRLNATLDGGSMKETLRAVAAALDLQYEREAETVVFYREEQGSAQSQ